MSGVVVPRTDEVYLAVHQQRRMDAVGFMGAKVLVRGQPGALSDLAGLHGNTGDIQPR